MKDLTGYNINLIDLDTFKMQLTIVAVLLLLVTNTCISSPLYQVHYLIHYSFIFLFRRKCYWGWKARWSALQTRWPVVLAEALLAAHMERTLAVRERFGVLLGINVLKQCFGKITFEILFYSAKANLRHV